jgi:hypothetical protein
MRHSVMGALYIHPPITRIPVCMGVHDTNLLLIY